MRCIFCKADSSLSKSVEHVIPESLGNKNQILAKGIVCDSCNSYFGNKIEKLVLEMPYFKSLRGRLMIGNKKGKIPKVLGFTSNGSVIEVGHSFQAGNTVEVTYNDDETLESIINSGEFYLPLISEPPHNDLLISKFIGLIALEALAQRTSSIEAWQDSFVDNEGFDDLRNYVRYGKGNTIWPYHIRRIDNEIQIKYCEKSNRFLEKLNEYDFLIPDKPAIDGELYGIENLYFVMAIMGVEYTINLTNGGLTRYFTWLADNQNKSILQMEKSEFHSNLKS